MRLVRPVHFRKKRCETYRGEFAVPRFAGQHPARNFKSAATGGMMELERK
jgi:hypothetical protein